MALDQAFNADTLSDLRKTVLALAIKAGMPASRAADVMLAVHELAANAVRHGGGAGTVRLSTDPRELHCLVSDAGADGPGGPDGQVGQEGQAGQAGLQPWPLTPGHGLWLVHKIADYVSVACGRGGSRVTAVFAFPEVAVSG